jgi:ABC-type Fe3+ transport system permease subunit
MIARRIIGCTVIFSTVLIRALVLEFYIYSPDIINYLWMGILSLAPVAFLLSVIVFLSLGLLKQIKLAEQTFDFLSSIVGWALSGLVIAAAIIIAISAYYESPQGPFSIIFLDGPLGVGVGTLVGFVMWLLRLRDTEVSKIV